MSRITARIKTTAFQAPVALATALTAVMALTAVAAVTAMTALLTAVAATALSGAPEGIAARWHSEWPRTDFSRSSVDLLEIRAGGPPRDGIPAIDEPRFITVAEAMADGVLAASEPLIALEINGDARAYPLRILIWHEIVNDVVGGQPAAITYCPLCNAALVFDRRVGDDILSFGVSGQLRHADLIMYDRQSESWWQQFSGEAIVGARTGQQLTLLASRLESWERFAARFPQGRVLVPEDPGARQYGVNPYRRYDSGGGPLLAAVQLPPGVKPMQRVVALGGEAWTLDSLAESGGVRTGGLQGGMELQWITGQNSALDAARIEDGRDVGNIVAKRFNRNNDAWEDTPYLVTFAFVFFAFYPEGVLHQ